MYSVVSCQVPATPASISVRASPPPHRSIPTLRRHSSYQQLAPSSIRYEHGGVTDGSDKENSVAGDPPLATCPQCGGQFSATYPLCPHCDAPIESPQIDRQLAELAIRLHMLTPEQARPLLDPAQGGAGERFLAAGVLSAKQLKFLRETLRFRAERAADTRFGTLAVERGWVTSEQVEAALKEQKQRYLQEHAELTVGDLLVASGALSAEQRDALLAEQHRRRQQADRPSGPEPRLEIAPDRTNASLQLHKDAPRFSYEQLVDLLAEYGVVHGLDEAALRGLADGSLPTGEPVVVARGHPPTPGEDGWVEYMFERHPLRAADQDDSVYIDYRDHGEIPQVTAETLLARRTPPKPGSEGIDISGYPLPPPTPREARLGLGKGVAFTEDGEGVVATIDGHPAVSATGMISVFPDYIIKGDLGNATGHVSFNGRVVVSGTVQAGFRVRCGELVAQEVEAADIETTGDVLIRGGVIGTHIRSGGSISARYLHHAHVEAMGDLLVAREVVESEVELSGAFHGERCTVLASRISARNGVWVKEVGSESSSPSAISVGIDDRVDHEAARLKLAIEQLQEQAAEQQRQIQEANHRLGKLELEIGKGAQLEDKARVKRREMVTKGVDTATLDQQISRLERMLFALFDEQEQLTSMVSSNSEALASGRTEQATLDAELAQLQAWSQDQEGRIYLEAKVLHVGTLVRAPAIQQRTTAERRQVRLDARNIRNPL